VGTVFTNVEWAPDRVENGRPPVVASVRLNPRVGTVFTNVEWASDRVENGCPPVVVPQWQQVRG
jgi:hypothetical protein